MMLWRDYYKTHPKEYTLWCACQVKGNNAMVENYATNEPVAVIIDGIEGDATEENLIKLAKTVNDHYSDWGDIKDNLYAILYDVMERVSCAECPWFDDCQHMDEIADLELDLTGYTVYWVGGKRDGELLNVFSDVDSAIAYARKFSDEHESEFDPVCGGVGITDTDGNGVVDW